MTVSTAAAAGQTQAGVAGAAAAARGACGAKFAAIKDLQQQGHMDSTDLGV